MKILGVDNVFVEVGDLEEAVRFYQDVVGLTVAKRFDDMGTVLFQIADETPGLGVASVDDPRASGHKLWFEVPDARSAADELTRAGVELLAPPFFVFTGWAVEIADPWGNVIGFTDYLGKPELGRLA